MPFFGQSYHHYLIKKPTFWITDRLPYSIRILLESAIRNCDDFQVTKNDVEKIIDWENTSPKLVEIPFKPARVLLQVWLTRLFTPFFLILYHVCCFQPLIDLDRILLVCLLLLTSHACVMPWTGWVVILIKLIPWCVLVSVFYLFYAVSGSIINNLTHWYALGNHIVV